MQIRRPILLLVLFFFSAVSIYADNGYCDVCTGRLEGRWWTINGKQVCSEYCGDSLRPKCSVCKKMIRTSRFKTLDGKPVCSTACMNRMLPKCQACRKPILKGYSVKSRNFCKDCTENGTFCFSCNMPAKFFDTLPDGRNICNNCMRWSVKTQEHAERNYDRARRQLEAWTSLKIETLPELQLVDVIKMKELSKKLRKTDDSLSIRGLYSRQVTIWQFTGLAAFFKGKKEAKRDETERIYIVDHLHDESFRTAAVHELMHDLIHEKFPHIAKGPLWLQEGICQYAAADFCRRKVYTENLHAIENSPDPDYGDGYRYVKSVVGMQGWHGLHKWMKTLNVKKLPKKAPKSQ